MVVALIFLVVFVLIAAMTALVANCYHKCACDEILVVYGKVGGDRNVKCIHGGGTFVWPMIQDYAYLRLTPMCICIPFKDVLSRDKAKVYVPAVFIVQISDDEELMYRAADCLLNLKADEIEDIARKIITAEFRFMVASMSLEEIYNDRYNNHFEFKARIHSELEPKLNKVGLHLEKVDITDITDDTYYLVNIGRKDAEEALAKARADMAQRNSLEATGGTEV